MRELVDAKQMDASGFTIDEEVYELLKRLTKSKDMSEKYKIKAQAKLDLLLNAESLILAGGPSGD